MNIIKLIFSILLLINITYAGPAAGMFAEKIGLPDVSTFFFIAIIISGIIAFFRK